MTHVDGISSGGRRRNERGSPATTWPSWWTWASSPPPADGTFTKETRDALGSIRASNGPGSRWTMVQALEHGDLSFAFLDVPV